jgi:PAS domain S-box-containing protein
MIEVNQISKKCLEAIVNHMPDPMFIIDMNGIVISWNRSMESLLKVPAEGVIGQHKDNLSTIFYGEKRPILADLLQNPNPEIEAKYEKFTRNDDGTVEGFTWAQKWGLYVWAKAAPFYDLEGNMIGIMEINRDVTIVRSQERKYKSLFGAMRTILDNVNLMIWAKDIDNKYTFVNKVYKNFLGLRSRDILGKKFEDFVQVEEDYSSENTDEIAKKSQYIDTVPIFYKGKKHWLSICKTPLIDECGLLVGTVGTAKDITENIEKKEDADQQVIKLKEEIEKGVTEWKIETELASVEVTRTIEEIRKSMYSVADNMKNDRDDYWGKIL